MHIPYIHTRTHARTDARTDRQTDRQPGRQADRQTDLHTYIHTYIHVWYTHGECILRIYIYIHICRHIYILSIDVQSKRIYTWIWTTYIHIPFCQAFPSSRVLSTIFPSTIWTSVCQVRWSVMYIYIYAHVYLYICTYTHTFGWIIAWTSHFTRPNGGTVAVPFGAHHFLHKFINLIKFAGVPEVSWNSRIHKYNTKYPRIW